VETTRSEKGPASRCGGAKNPIELSAILRRPQDISVLAQVGEGYAWEANKRTSAGIGKKNVTGRRRDRRTTNVGGKRNKKLTVPKGRRSLLSGILDGIHRRKKP